MFALKKLAEYLLEPLSLVLLLMLCGALLRRARPRVAHVVFGLAGVVLVALSLPPVARWLARGLEARYAPLETTHAPGNIRAIVVLSGSYEAAPGRHIWDTMNSATMRRTLEGVRLARALPLTTLILSGGSPWGGAPAAQGMAEFAIFNGIAPRRLQLEQVSKDTADQAALLAPRLGKAPFILVTSAYHLERSVALFRRAGTTPVPSATDYLTGDQPADSFAPDLQALEASQAALHEHLGMLWGRLRGQL